MSKPVSIGRVVNGVVGKIERSKAGRSKRFSEAWEKAAGDAVEHARVVRAEKGRLFIAVDSSVWMQELSMQKAELLRRMRALLGADAVKDLVFRSSRGL